jgi:hypothetical protein
MNYNLTIEDGDTCINVNTTDVAMLKSVIAFCSEQIDKELKLKVCFKRGKGQS